MNTRRPFAMQLALAAYMLECPEAFTIHGPADNQAYYAGRARFSPSPDAQFLRRQTITRGERSRRGEVVR